MKHRVTRRTLFCLWWLDEGRPSGLGGGDRQEPSIVPSPANQPHNFIPYGKLDVSLHFWALLGTFWCFWNFGQFQTLLQLSLPSQLVCEISDEQIRKITSRTHSVRQSKIGMFLILSFRKYALQLIKPPNIRQLTRL